MSILARSNKRMKNAKYSCFKIIVESYLNLISDRGIFKKRNNENDDITLCFQLNLNNKYYYIDKIIDSIIPARLYGMWILLFYIGYKINICIEMFAIIS